MNWHRWPGLYWQHVWGRSSAGRAPRSQCGGREFDPPRLHQSSNGSTSGFGKSGRSLRGVIRSQVGRVCAVCTYQIANNTEERAMLGDFEKAVDDEVLDSSDAHQNQTIQLLSDPEKAEGFARVVFDLLKLAE